MTFLYVLLAIAALVPIAANIPVTIDVRANEELSVRLKLLFVSYKLYPKKEKPIDLSRWKIKRYRKRRLKEQRKYLKKKLLKEAKDKRLKDFADSHTEELDKVKKRSKDKLKDRAEYVVDIINNAVKTALLYFGKKLKIKLYCLRITVGGGEPDKVAISYGYICQAVSYLNEILKNHTNVSYPGSVDRRLYVGVDYLAPKTTMEAHLSFRLTLWQLLRTVGTGVFGYITTEKR